MTLLLQQNLGFAWGATVVNEFQTDVEETRIARGGPLRRLEQVTAERRLAPGGPKRRLAHGD